MSSTCVPPFPHECVITWQSQTELAINTHVTVSNTHAIVSELGGGVTSTRAMVSDIHRTIVQDREGSGGKHSPVSDSRASAAAE